MTINIAFNFDDRYGLFCADNRTTWEISGRRRFQDSSCKIEDWGCGLVMSAGLTWLGDSVKARLQENADPGNTDNILRFIAEEQSRYREILRSQGRPEEEVDSWIGQTGWFISYFTIIDHAPTLRIAVIHPSLESSTPPHGIPAVGRNTVRLHVSLDLGRERADMLSEVASTAFRPMSDFASHQEHFEYHRGVCALLVRLASRMTDTVSSSMHVAIHHFGVIQISEQQKLGEEWDNSRLSIMFDEVATDAE